MNVRRGWPGAAGPLFARRAYTVRVESLRGLIQLYDTEVAALEEEIGTALDGHRGFPAIQAISGVGPVLGAVFVAEIGDVGRFPGADKLAGWAGLTPRHRESDTTAHRGSITKQGSKLVRWAAIEAISRQRGGTFLQSDYRRIAERRNDRQRPPGSRPPASSSPWSSTACATGSSAAWPNRPHETD